MSTVPTSPLTRAFVLDSVEREFASPSRKAMLSKVCSRFQAPARALLFGGVIRNAVLASTLHRPFPKRDADFVVFGVASDESLYEALKSFHPHRNSFGGIKIDMDGSTVDIWRAELEQLIAGQPPVVSSLDDFLQCVTLTTDAVLYDSSEGMIYEEGFIQAVNERTIDIGARSCWIEPWIHYHLAHLAYVRALTGFVLSPRARQVARQALSESMVEQAVAYLTSRHKCDDPRQVLLALARESGL